jgi:hypothetical protein
MPQKPRVKTMKARSRSFIVTLPSASDALSESVCRMNCDTMQALFRRRCEFIWYDFAQNEIVPRTH